MSGKFWLLTLFTAVVLSCGCHRELKGDKMEMQAKLVKLQTNMGEIIIELDEQAAPISVENFHRYVEEGFYNELIFLRVISDFMIQGGGFTTQMVRKETHAPIINEASNGLKNDRGTIAMARTNDPDSATSQFFINLKNNDFLNYIKNQNPGYAVFGRIIEGMNVVDKIAAVKTNKQMGMSDVPVKLVVIKSAEIIQSQ